MILVTGAAGKTGLALLRALKKRGAPTRAFARREAQIADLKSAGASEVAVGDLENLKDLDGALSGIDSLYLIVPNVHPREIEIGEAVISAAQAAGVGRMVYHSVLFPQLESMPHHWRKLRVEEALIQSGLPFTILQPANYMQNILGYWDEIVRTGVYRLPYSPASRSSPVDLEDVAEVAAQVLLEGGHVGATYPLAGPEVLSSEDLAQQLARGLGQPVEVEQAPLSEWQVTARASGLDEERLQSLSKMFAYYNAHDFTGSSTVLKSLLGRAPTTFETFLKRTNN